MSRVSPPDFTAEILEAERQRAAAVMARDLDAVAACLHDELVYVHATGRRHDKAGVLRYLADGPRFLVVGLQAPQVSACGNAALVEGRLQLHLQRAGEPVIVRAESWLSELWLRDSFGRWQLRLFHSTRVAP